MIKGHLTASIEDFTQFTEELLEDDTTLCGRCGRVLAFGTDLELYL
jgi:hypothetical protein